MGKEEACGLERKDGIEKIGGSRGGGAGGEEDDADLFNRLNVCRRYVVSTGGDSSMFFGQERRKKEREEIFWKELKEGLTRLLALITLLAHWRFNTL